jgi:hypothetical protein
MRSKTIFHWALINFILTAMIGLGLRLFSVGLVTGFHYKHWLHAHSHLAFLGWIYPAIIAFLVDQVPGRQQKDDRIIRYLFLCMQLAVFSLLITFPGFGYGWPSIVALSIHMTASIWLVFHIIKRLPDQHARSGSFIKAGAWMMVVSGLGALALGPVAAMGLKYTPWYNGSVYFYLHFQYNGWFPLALTGIVLTMLRSSDAHEDRLLKRGLNHLIVAVILTYPLSLIGFQVPWWIYASGSVGSIIQLIAFLLISLVFIRNRAPLFKDLSAVYRWILIIAFVFLWIKILIQCTSSIPVVAATTYKSRDLVMAYLHFFLLGTLTIGLLGLAFRKIWFNLKSKLNIPGIMAFFGGFAVTEAILVIRGLMPALSSVSDHYVMAIGAGMMLLGIVLLTVSALSCLSHENKIE